MHGLIDLFGRKALKIRKLKVLFVASEAAPFAKVGGLGEVMYSLPRALREIGHDARVMIPRYGTVDRDRSGLTMVHEGVAVPTGGETPPLICNVLKHEEEGVSFTYFLENEEYYEKRANVYGYADDPIRWLLLSRGTLEFLKVSDWVPDIIIANDWQAGFIPNLLHTDYAHDPALDSIATGFVIHNLSHQGMFDHHFVSEMNYDAGQSLVSDMFSPRLLQLNPMRRGIMHADIILTVSPTYAKEILTKEFGEGLNDLLAERRTRLFGVINGIDYDHLDPTTDQYIAAPFTTKTASRRAKNKRALQNHFGLHQNDKSFLIGIVSRMDHQKGFDLIMDIANPLFRETDIQLLVLGSGDNKYRLFFKELSEKYPGRVAGHFEFDPVLPRSIFAGSDAILIPSAFEPSGLTQMEAMRYGCIPIARETGGLADTIIDYDGELDIGDGFLFEAFDSWALFAAIIRARETHRHPDIWHELIVRAMEKDFSWIQSAKEYERHFMEAIEYHKRVK
ncbi:MAG: glycogen/starch synthase [bacterium]|nr:glycogen/starch synthase [bacterium]